MDREQNERLRRRKSEHIDICLNEQVNGERISTGLERYRFVHNALPEIDFAEIDTSAVFLDKPVKTPFLISSMTGGTERAAEMNRRLAAAAEQRGWSMGVGSMRTAIEHGEAAFTYEVRKYAPTIPILANLGAVQLNYGYDAEQCRRAVELIGADALVLHLNGMQEVFQPEGNTNFSGLLKKIEAICRRLDVPVGVKEVGWGISGAVAASLLDAGAAFIDIAGAGGTSWSQVEKYRSADAIRRKAAEAFANWGIPTAECIVDARGVRPDAFLIASGGITSGVDAAKCLALGADMAGFGRTLLSGAADSQQALEEKLLQVEFEFRSAMFGIGAKTLTDLKTGKALKTIDFP